MRPGRCQEEFGKGSAPKMENEWETQRGIRQYGTLGTLGRVLHLSHLSAAGQTENCLMGFARHGSEMVFPFAYGGKCFQRIHRRMA